MVLSRARSESTQRLYGSAVATAACDQGFACTASGATWLHFYRRSMHHNSGNGKPKIISASVPSPQHARQERSGRDAEGFSLPAKSSARCRDSRESSLLLDLE